MFKNCVMFSRIGSFCMQINKPSLSSLETVRHLYSLSSLGVDNYVTARERVALQFQEISDKFKQKMTDYASKENQMIFTEDLKHIVHLIEPTQEDLQLVEQMLLKFSRQNKEMRFGSFVFGPVVMRMYHHLNKPLEAVKVFKNPEMAGFFDQLISFQILLDLLYNNEMYEEILDVFTLISQKQVQGSKYPKNSVVLVLAACYKMNNEEAFTYAKKLWAALNDIGHYPMRKAVTFFAALAVSQNAPGIALEVLTSVKQQSYVTVRNLKVVALADLGRTEDCLPVLRSVLEVDSSQTQGKHTFALETIEKVSIAVQKTNKTELMNEFDRIVKQLQSLGFIGSESMDSLLCKEIQSPVQFQSREQTYFNKRSINPRNQFQRPSIRSMV